MAARPRRLVLVTGTGTEVGKTWVAAEVLRRAAHRGAAVAARKPVQSFAPGPAPTDSEVLAGATGESAEVVCPAHRNYPKALAPPMAARALDRPAFLMADLVGEIDRSWPDPAVDLGLVEGAGGVASPLAADGDSADLARAIGADRAVVVADPALGVIHSVRLSVPALAPIPALVYLNRFDEELELHRLNHEWLTAHGFTVAVSPDALLDRLTS